MNQSFRHFRVVEYLLRCHFTFANILLFVSDKNEKKMSKWIKLMKFQILSRVNSVLILFIFNFKLQLIWLIFSGAILCPLTARNFMEIKMIFRYICFLPLLCVIPTLGSVSSPSYTLWYMLTLDVPVARIFGRTSSISRSSLWW